MTANASDGSQTGLYGAVMREVYGTVAQVEGERVRASGGFWRMAVNRTVNADAWAEYMRHGQRCRDAYYREGEWAPTTR